MPDERFRDYAKTPTTHWKLTKSTQVSHNKHIQTLSILLNYMLEI